MNFVVLNNDSILTPVPNEGGGRLSAGSLDGAIQARLVLGNFSIGGMKLSSDRKCLAMEQYPLANHSGAEVPAGTFKVAVYESTLHKGNATIPSCSQLLDIASGGKVVAVVRENQIELWDTATTKKRKVAPFQHTRIGIDQLLTRWQAARDLRPQRGWSFGDGQRTSTSESTSARPSAR